MSNPFKQFVNQFNKYSRSDRNAILILSGLILIVVTVNVILRNIESKPKFDSSGYEKIADELEAALNGESVTESLFYFNPNTVTESQLDSLLIPSKIKQNLLAYRKAGGKFYSSNSFRKLYGMNDSVFNAIEHYIILEEKTPKAKSKNIAIKKKITGYFNPNKADFDELKKFGFNNYQAKNLISYREKGGVFKDSKDLLKIYGVDTAFYKTLQNHIQIEKQIEVPVKKKIVEVYNIELNETDSIGLVNLPGIGSVYATRIIKYRKLLGGYYSKKQLLEVYNFPEETFLNIEKYISVDSALIRKIRINFAEFKDLLRHPYLNKKQVKAILNFKEKNGAFESISTLQLIDEIDPVTYSKVKPYFTCR